MRLVETLASAAIVIAPGKNSVIIRRILLNKETVTKTYFFCSIHSLEIKKAEKIEKKILPFQQ